MVLLVVHGPNPTRRPHFATTRRRCERVALLASPPGAEAAYADVVLDVPAYDLDACVAAARDLHGRERVDGVVTFVEHCVLTAATIADALGLPAVSPATALLARDKHAMRERLAAAGLPCPRFGLATSAAEGCALAQRFGYPLILKPVIGGGSKYVQRVDSDGELRAHFDALRDGAWSSFRHDAVWSVAHRRHGPALLVEEYVPGAEVSIESLVVDGGTRTLAIHDKPLPMEGPFFEEDYASTPSRLPAAVQDELLRLTSAGNDALGIGVGATHSEFRITPEGRVVFLEVAARIGGGPIYGCVLASTGVDMVAAIVDQARGRPLAPPRPAARPAGLLTLFAGRFGRLRAVRGEDALRAHPAVAELEVYRRPGERVYGPPLTAQGDAHVVFTGATLDELDRLCAQFQGMLAFDVDDDPPPRITEEAPWPSRARSRSSSIG